MTGYEDINSVEINEQILEKKIKRRILFLSLIVILVSFLIFVTVFIFPFLFGYFNMIETCGNDITGTIPSPDGKYKAILFTRDCGATTRKGYQMSIFKKNKELKNNSGNIFVSFHPFTVDWHGNKEIEIDGVDYDQFTHEIEYKDIKIIYK